MMIVRLELFADLAFDEDLALDQGLRQVLGPFALNGQKTVQHLLRKILVPQREDFVLNQAPFRNAKVLVVAENFGCGSSREAAVWTLEAYGIRAVIAPSLGDIFHENCYKNGLLPVILSRDVVDDLRRQLHARAGATMTVDLETQTVTDAEGVVHRFNIDPVRKQALLRGQDEIALTLSYEAAVVAFEARHARAMPWLERASGP